MIKKINIKTIIIFLLVIFGFLLRTYKWSQLNMFAGDEGIQLIYAEDILSGKYFTITGEVSSLDQGNKYILHNSPLGLYFQAILYLLSFKTAEIYLFSYVVLNMITVTLLYKTIKIIASKKTAYLAGVILLFSPFMLHASVWTSQPINALFFESIAIYLIAKFIKQKKDKLFLVGTIASVIATQMYPPMYLLLFPKVFLFLYLLRNNVKEKKKIFLYFILAVTLIYFPFVVMELKYNQVNSKAILSFIEELKTSNLETKTTNSMSIIDKFGYLFSNISSFISYSFQDKKLVFILYTIFISLNFSKNANFKERKIVLTSAAFLLTPILIFSLLLLKDSVSGERAYIDIIFPYLIIFFALIHSKTKQLLINFFIVIYILITILPMRFYFLKPSSELVSLDTINKSINTILKKTGKERQNTLIHVISEGDKWGWDSSIYWYLLENKTRKDLVSINFYTSKPKLNINIEPEKINLICHNYPVNKCLSDWETINNSGFYKEKFSNIEDRYNIDQNTVIVLTKDKL